MTSTYRIVLAELPLNERVTKQAQDGDALLHRRVGEAPTILDGEKFGPLWIGTMSQVMDIQAHLLTSDGFRNNPATLAKSQKVIESAPVGIDSFGSKLKVTL